jgi:hypothetical protein
MNKTPPVHTCTPYLYYKVQQVYVSAALCTNHQAKLENDIKKYIYIYIYIYI